ncbi:DUF3078 domain-containing protein [Pricia sp. S334]|uniref:DUF3078 domain-containing protein n=1 Tax=Pricia mediterranea TaxID=3076079 RepID=A0ABU3L5V8_9FLAO|nr:DUF3078 domain-containing protein [Pricia sp. S334]MDT7829115.1 DUF3078 domain-containing protein [Pricia sp. S334]
MIRVWRSARTALTVLFLFCLNFLSAQKNDSLPPGREVDTVAIDTAAIDRMVEAIVVDTVVVDTVVIRRIQNKMEVVPRSVNLTNPVISFRQTKALTEEPNRFRIPSFWTNVNRLGINFNEVAFVNWNAGGNNSIAALGNARFERNYKFRYTRWDNYMELRYGLNLQEGQKLRKTDDAIRLSSTLGFQRDTISNWYYSAKANLNTQFSNGYKYPDRETPVSAFMAPGYTFLGAGTSYITKDQKFNLYISPITQKSTFVLNQELANKGRFGVQRAILDAEGNVVKPGNNVFLEFGFLVTNSWETEVYKNVALEHRLSLYTDYLQDFGNIDVDWELNIGFKVNDFILTKIGSHIIFDDNVLFGEEINEQGIVVKPGESRIQFKQQLGVGISYAF